jgi:uncharacterized membrane protein
VGRSRFGTMALMRWRRFKIVRLARARPRLLISLAVAIAVAMLLPEQLTDHRLTRWLIAWNAGSLLYVILVAVMMHGASSVQIRHRAQLQDEGQYAILVLVVLAAIASLGAIGGELAVVKDMHGLVKRGHIALAGLTVVSSWAFIQVMFAMHYANIYYAALAHGQPAGLRFPHDLAPDFGDFFYFSAIIGTSGQTADVAFVSRSMRRIGSVHCILAYMFNTVVLALLINIGASMF